MKKRSEKDRHTHSITTFIGAETRFQGELNFDGTVLAVVFGFLAVPGLVAGIGLLKYQNWARILNMILSIFDLLAVPIGSLAFGEPGGNESPLYRVLAFAFYGALAAAFRQPQAFEVGPEVREAYLADLAVPGTDFCFVPNERGRYLADLYQLARLVLQQAGVASVHGGGWCTHDDAGRFFSFRRDGVTGRMATLAWLA